MICGATSRPPSTTKKRGTDEPQNGETGKRGNTMDIATMFDLVSMVKFLTCENHIVDYVFCSDGKSFFVRLSNGEEYTFTV